MKNNQPLLLVVTNNAIYIDSAITSDIYQGLKKVLRYRPEDYYFRVRQFEKKQQQRGKKWSWDGWINLICRDKRWCRCYLKKEGVHFATGFYSLVVKFLKDHNIPFQVIDKRKKYEKNLFLKMSKACEDRGYQTKFIDACVKVERGVTKAATGAGKTFMGAKIIQQIGVSPFIVYVPSIDLLNQTKDEFEKFLQFKNGKRIKVGIVGDGKFDPQDITIMTVQTAVRACGEKYVKYDDEDKNKEDKTLDDKRKAILELVMSARGFIADECMTGDAVVCVKNHGKVKIDELDRFIGEDVRSFDGISVVWKKITNFMDKGKRKTIKILLNSGKVIKCTKNHPIRTQRGWIQAGLLTEQDEILSIANVSVAKKYLKMLANIFPDICPIKYNDVCPIKYDKVSSVVDSDEENVYDITVEDTHCFFANDLLVHNCQHWASETCQTIADYSVSARYRYPFSATPFRDKNDDILITGCFGKDIINANVSASDLIRLGYLVKPNIYFVNIPGHKHGYTYQTIYKKYIVENVFRNEKIVSVATNMMDAGNVVLVLVRQITHGKILEKMMPQSVFLYSKHSGKKRKERLDLMRTGKPSITLTSSIFDEGIDCKALNTLILAGSGKSPTRALQRIGRTLRPFAYSDGRKKEFATVVDFMDNYKYLQSHSKKRKKIYRTESEFVIEELEV